MVLLKTIFILIQLNDAVNETDIPKTNKAILNKQNSFIKKYTVHQLT